ncbi:MAG: hypothetical protein IT385_08540 [Deltaproteobacteria bacterium]|nr:hypothetical protein [Deltaproteobacteria bacterium]
MRSALLLSGTLLATLAACSDDTNSGAGANLGVAGASCVRTPDCRSPLQCIDLVCRDPNASGADATGDGGDSSYTIDGTNPYEGEVTPDIVTAYDVNDWEFVSDTAPDVADTTTGETTNPFEDCGELGIDSSWQGTFIGEIDYNLTPNEFTPSQGTLPVNGSLGFDITCIESKFIVRGEMLGLATVQDQGDFPFELQLVGTYDPREQKLNAKMEDGSVSIYGLIIVYFEGDFVGSIVDDEFQGQWTGYSTGTNQTFITGTASGEGLWAAAPE